jgi:hypothetical protein
VDEAKTRLRGQGRRRTAGKVRKHGRGGPPLDARLVDGAQDAGHEKDGRGSRRRQVRDGARRARVLVLWNEGRVRGMVGREELRPLREDLQAVDVAEGPAQRQLREQGDDGGAAEKASHDWEVYAAGL